MLKESCWISAGAGNQKATDRLWLLVGGLGLLPRMLGVRTEYHIPFDHLYLSK